MGFAVALWNDLDPSIANVKIYSDEWGVDEDGNDTWALTELPTHICTDEELGFNGDSNDR